MTPRGEYVRPLLKDIEINHFTPEREGLIAQGNARFGDDFDYVLRAVPNHHRALVAMQNLSKREGKEQPMGARRTVECYFERALRFAPGDHLARRLYANFLIEANRSVEAEREIDRADSDSQDLPVARLSVGLLYARNGNLDKALMQAKRAEELGIDISPLRRLLEERNVWPSQPASAPSASPVVPASPASSAGQ